MNLYSSKSQSFHILDDLKVIIQVSNNPLNLPLESLFEMAARINKKRSFLFVSKVLGKHLPVNPFISLMGGAILGLLYYKHEGYTVSLDQEDMSSALQNPKLAEKIYRSIKSNPLELTEPTLFIGFAETATALGHSMYDIFSGPTKYIHTTREDILEKEPSISFEEEHSHATAHRCYNLDEQFLKGKETVVLVDDEITTGKTALNIIRDLHGKSPREKYIITSLLDWRSEEDKERFKQVERELGVSITCLSVLQGKIFVTGGPVERQPTGSISTIQSEPQILHHSVGQHFKHALFSSSFQNGMHNKRPYLTETGRFGLKGQERVMIDERISNCARELRKQRRGQKTLCMGTGEFMFVPMRIAAEMGDGVYYQSSTRSPIHPNDEGNYAIRKGYSFPSQDDHSVINFFYNIHSGMYDEIFVFIERVSSEDMLTPLIDALKKTEIPIIHFVHFNNN